MLFFRYIAYSVLGVDFYGVVYKWSKVSNNDVSDIEAILSWFENDITPARFIYALAFVFTFTKSMAFNFIKYVCLITGHYR